MILYSDKCTELTELLVENYNNFSSILIKGDYGKGKSSLIRHVLSSLPNSNIIVTQYPGMTTPYEALSSALREVLEKQTIDMKNVNMENPYREYLKQVCINICRQTPHTIIVFQDMRDYEENFIELIREIVIFLNANNIPCSVLMEYSTDNLSFEQREQLVKCENLCQNKKILLNSEDYNEYIDFISELLNGEDDITVKQKKGIIKEAFFNPALIQRMISYFVDTGIFFQRENVWKCDEIDFHITAKLLEQHIYQRYLKLDEELKKTLDRASITGYEIRPRLLYQPLGIIKSEENLKRIERLSRLIVHTENSYEFENNTVYNLISDKMNSSERKALHLLVAEYLFQKIEDCKHTHVLLNVLNVIKNHYLYAEHIDKALHILGCYVQQAYLERNYDAALSGIREFRELSNGKFPYAEQQLAIKEVKIQQILGNFSQSYLELTHIQKKYLPSGTENWIEYLKAYALFNSGKTNEAKQIADELVKKLDTKLIQDEYLLLKLDILLAGMYHHFGNVAYAAKRYEQGIAISARNVGYEKEYNYLLSISNMFLADELAILQITKSMKYFNEKHLMVSYAKCANNIAISYIYLGEYKKATALLEESIHIFSDMCSISVHYPITNLGTVYALMNQYDIALDYFIQARNNPVEDFSILWITINMSHCKRKLGDFDACKVLLDEVQQKINKMTTNTALLERNLHIARTLLYLDKEDYSAAYDDCQQALEIEVNVLHNDTYPIYITKLLINIIEQLALPLPSVAEPYKCGRESEYCKDLLKSGAHWGNFLFWEM